MPEGKSRRHRSPHPQPGDEEDVLEIVMDEKRNVFPSSGNHSKLTFNEETTIQNSPSEEEETPSIGLKTSCQEPDESCELPQEPSLRHHQVTRMEDVDDAIGEGDVPLPLEGDKKINTKERSALIHALYQCRMPSEQQRRLPGAVRVPGNAAHAEEDQDVTNNMTTQQETAPVQASIISMNRFRAPENASIVAVAKKVDDEEQQVGSRQLAVAIQCNPDAKNNPHTFDHKLRRISYKFLASAIVVALVIGVAVGVVLCIGEEKDTVLYPDESTGIEARVEQVVGVKTLHSKPDSPYSKALDWIVHDDPMQHDADDPQLIQRYIAAYFWYATTVDGPWRSCNPPSTNSSSPTATATYNTKCLWSVIYNDRRGSQLITETYETLANAWLSNITECNWAGVKCDKHNQIVKLDMRK